MQRFIAVILAAALIAAACKESSGPGGGTGGSVNDYLEALPSWAQFSPLQASLPPTPAGSAEALPPDTIDVEQIQEDGSVQVLPDVVYTCVSQPYTLRDNPQQLVMYSPDVDLLWPGALIQGKSHRDGLGALLGLTIAERTPIRVSIPSLPTGQNFREVAGPNQATVSAAIGEMLGNATRDGLSTPSTITFQQRVYHSEQEFALSVGASGRYLGFSGSATGDFSRNASETTVSAQFYQRMFEVVLAPPQSPGAFFSSDFTQAKLDQQVALGRIGPDNIPVYVSNIVYGRMMMFSITSTATEQEIRGTLQLAYNGIGGGGSGSLSAKQKTILQESKIAVTSLGGDAQATLNVIRSGDWSHYFTDNAPLSSAAPLSYTFRNLGDGSIASVTEATNYNLKTCAAQAATPGTFSFGTLAQHTLAVPSPVRTLTGDFNGDGRTDLAWNHAGGTNEMYLALANSSGTFTTTAPVTHPSSPSEGWANYETVVGDVNGDGRADLIWNYRGATATGQNRSYLGLSNGDGTFAFPSVRIHPLTSWPGYRVLVGNVDGDADDDLIWNGLSAATNASYLARSDGVSDFTFDAAQSFAGNWSAYWAWTANVDGDNDTDLIWNVRTTTANATYIGRSNGNGTLTLAGPFSAAAINWTPFSTLTGDVNGDGKADLIWADTTATSNQGRVAIGRSTSTSTTSNFSFPALQTAPTYAPSLTLRVRAGDVNGDGRADLLWNAAGTTNRLFVALGTGDATSASFDFSPVGQLHPAAGVPWDQFTLFLVDVNGDGRADAVWNHAAANNQLYVALARP
jgi:thiol-activated cytolysin/VCBS repeat protein